MSLNTKKRFSLANLVLNISKAEWPRVRSTWLLSFLFRVGFVIGWSTLTGIFVSRFGIQKLPILFIANGIFIILGTIFYADIVKKVKREWLMIVTAVTAALFLFGATFFAKNNDVMFFTLLLFAESVLLTQLNIVISLFREELFSPLESERTFPVIESAETIGSIAGGLIIAIGTFYIPVYKFIFIWIVALTLIVPVVMHANYSFPKIPCFRKKKPDKEIGAENVFKRVKKSIQHLRAIPFLKALFVVILVQWIFVNILEFQYTKAIEQVVSHTEEESLVFHEYGRIFNVSLLTDIGAGDNEELSTVPNKASESLSAENYKEKALVQKLGSLHILFGGFALLMQLFLAGRLLQSLGVTGGMLIYPVIMMFSLIGMFFKFGFTSALITKTNFEIGNVIHKNAYHSSYYALGQGIREEARESLEGFVRPLGGIVGMALLLVVQSVFTDKTLTMWINVILMALIFIIFATTLEMQGKYTQLSKKMLLFGKDDAEKWDAVEILGQKGHTNASKILMEALASNVNEPELRAKIIGTLGVGGDMYSLPVLLDHFHDPNRALRLEAVRAVENYKKLLEIDPNDKETNYNLSVIYKRLSDAETSQLYYNKYLQSNNP